MYTAMLGMVLHLHRERAGCTAIELAFCGCIPAVPLAAVAGPRRWSTAAKPRRRRLHVKYDDTADFLPRRPLATPQQQGRVPTEFSFFQPPSANDCLGSPLAPRHAAAACRLGECCRPRRPTVSVGALAAAVAWAAAIARAILLRPRRRLRRPIRPARTADPHRAAAAAARAANAAPDDAAATATTPAQPVGAAPGLFHREPPAAATCAAVGTDDGRRTGAVATWRTATRTSSSTSASRRCDRSFLPTTATRSATAAHEQSYRTRLHIPGTQHGLATAAIAAARHRAGEQAVRMLDGMWTAERNSVEWQASV